MKTIKTLTHKDRKAVVKYSMNKDVYYVHCDDHEAQQFDDMDSAIDQAKAYVEGDDSTVVDSGTIQVFPRGE